MKKPLRERRKKASKVRKERGLNGGVTGNVNRLTEKVSPQLPSKEHEAEAKAEQPRRGKREPPESEAGYTRQVDRSIPETKVTERKRRQEQASSHLLLRERYWRENEEEREKLLYTGENIRQRKTVEKYVGPPTTGLPRELTTMLVILLDSPSSPSRLSFT
ncbi:LOW QUALITY PROTEIN: hypothetical protein YC2023_010275 [Brassica napus]